MTTADNGTNQNSATAFFEAWQDMIRKSTEAWSQAASGFGGFTPPNPGGARLPSARSPLAAFPSGSRRAPALWDPLPFAPPFNPADFMQMWQRMFEILAVAMDEQPSRGKPAAVH